MMSKLFYYVMRLCFIKYYLYLNCCCYGFWLYILELIIIFRIEVMKFLELVIVNNGKRLNIFFFKIFFSFVLFIYVKFV